MPFREASRRESKGGGVMGHTAMNRRSVLFQDFSAAAAERSVRILPSVSGDREERPGKDHPKMKPIGPTVLFLDRNDLAGQKARAIAGRTFTLCASEPGYLLNFMGEAILLKAIWGSAKIAALNFHPGPPEYPGRGSANWALYDNAREFGVTCHHIIDPVDAGPIVSVRRFPIHLTDTVETLVHRAHDELLILFYEIIDTILTQTPLPQSREVWRGAARTRKQLNELAACTVDMDEFEVERRIRATSYLEWQPELLFRGRRWKLAV